MGKSSINGSFSIAMLVYWRVSPSYCNPLIFVSQFPARLADVEEIHAGSGLQLCTKTWRRGIPFGLPIDSKSTLTDSKQFELIQNISKL